MSTPTKLTIHADWMHLTQAANIATDYLLGPYCKENRATAYKGVGIRADDYDGSPVFYLVWGDVNHVRVRQQETHG